MFFEMQDILCCPNRITFAQISSQFCPSLIKFVQKNLLGDAAASCNTTSLHPSSYMALYVLIY